MFRLSLISSLVASVLIAGCATGYGKKGLLGGMKSEWIESDVLEVESLGNGFTGGYKTVEMTTLWTAEKAKEKGFKYFEFQDFDGTQYSGGNRPRSEVTVRALMFNEVPTDRGTIRLYDVDEIIAELGPKYIDDMKEKSE